jgi:hypothetical protein
MVIALILNFIADIIQQIFIILPDAYLHQLPYIGTYIETYLTMAVQYMNTATQVIPFTAIVWHTFTLVILPFEFSMIIAKFFFGSRLPVNK